MKNLETVYRRRSSRQRIILYLLARGASLATLENMTSSELAVCSLPADLDVHRDVVVGSVETNDKVFSYPSGRAMNHTDFIRIVSQATNSALGKAMSVKEYSRWALE